MHKVKHDPAATGTGGLCDMIAAQDWSRTSLGPREEWPLPLNILIDVMLGSAQPMFVVWGPEQILLYNDPYAEILASKHPAALGQPFLEVWNEIRDDLIPVVEQAYGGTPVRMDDIRLIMHRKGYPEETHFAFSYTPVRSAEGTVAGFFCACVETTAQLAETRQRLAERERLERMFEQAPGLIAMLESPDHRFVLTNATYRRLIGGRDVVGMTVREALPELEGQGFNQLLDRVFATGEAFCGESMPVWITHEPGQPPEQRFVDFIYQPITDAQGTVTGIFVEGVDVTERKRAETALRERETQLRRLNETLEQRVLEELAARVKTEEALRQSQKMEAIGQLTGGVAHDFNNLLTVIRSSADLLRRIELSDEKRRRYLDAIADTADRAAKLTRQLLAFARRQALRPEVFNVGRRVDEIAEMMRTVVGPRVDLLADTDCETCFVEADASQFETALVNMAVNARDAMDGVGRLEIKVRPSSHVPRVRGHGEASGAFVSVSIRDTGHGIPPDKIDQIFEPFFTTKEVGKGTGLGLSQVYGFAKQSGGEVSVHSRPDEGTIFTLYLPSVEASEVQEPRRGDAADQGGERGHILVVEDNEQVGAFSTQLLIELGFETSWAGNADKALELLTAHPGRYAALFSDVVMPGRSGVELAREVRRLYPDLPIILTSGYSHVLAQEGIHGFELIHKPYSVEDLTRVLRRAIRQGQRMQIA